MRWLRYKGLASIAVVALVIILAALLGVAGCGASQGETSTTVAEGEVRYGPAMLSPSTTWASPATAAAATATTVASEGAYDDNSLAGTPAVPGTDVSLVDTAVKASSQKIITDAQLEIQVEKGKFQTAFDQALLLADRYGGYLVSSNSSASGEDESMKSGTIAVRVPSGSLTQALRDVEKLGKVRNESLGTQDVTEEYVDLQARIKNSQAHVDSLVALLGQAKTVNDVLQVQDVLTSAQEELEQLEGRMRYLNEHTTYSTITMTIYEAGTEVKPATSWGVRGAFSAALHNLVRAFNAIVRGLGVLIPVLIVLAIIAYLVFLIVRAIVRRNRRRQQAAFQHYQQGWQGPGAGPGVAQSGPSASEPAPTEGEGPAAGA